MLARAAIGMEHSSLPRMTRYSKELRATSSSATADEATADEVPSSAPAAEVELSTATAVEVAPVLEVSGGGERKVASTISSASAKHRIRAGWRLSCVKTRSRSKLFAGMLPQIAEHEADVSCELTLYRR